jgi:hypothetical protein
MPAKGTFNVIAANAHDTTGAGYGRNARARRKAARAEAARRAALPTTPGPTSFRDAAKFRAKVGHPWPAAAPTPPAGRPGPVGSSVKKHNNVERIAAIAGHGGIGERLIGVEPSRPPRPGVIIPRPTPESA